MRRADFVANENVDRYLGMLRRPHLTSEKRTTLQGLLVDELDNLGRDREQLELSERRVREGKERIARLRSMVSTLSFGDQRQQRDLSVLSTMEAIQNLLEDYHCQLRDEIFPYCIMLQSTMVGGCVSLDEARQRAQQFANINPKRVVMIIDRSNGDSYVVCPR